MQDNVVKKRPKKIKITIPNYLISYDAILSYKSAEILESLMDLCCDEYYYHLKFIPANFMKKSIAGMFVECAKNNSVICFEYLNSLRLVENNKLLTNYSIIENAIIYNSFKFIEHLIIKYINKNKYLFDSSYFNCSIINENHIMLAINKNNIDVCKLLLSYTHLRNKLLKPNYLIDIFKIKFFENNLDICKFILEYEPEILLKNHDWLKHIFGFEGIQIYSKIYDNIDTYKWFYFLNKKKLDETNFSELYLNKILTVSFISVKIKNFISEQYDCETIELTPMFKTSIYASLNTLLSNSLSNIYNYNISKLIFELFKYFYDKLKEFGIQVDLIKHYNDIKDIKNTLVKNIIYVFIEDGLVIDNFKDLCYDYYMMKKRFNIKKYHGNKSFNKICL